LKETIFEGKEIVKKEKRTFIEKIEKKKGILKNTLSKFGSHRPNFD